ncbi:MAG: CBS domain-containing protein [Pseudomonadota bacterium]
MPTSFQAPMRGDSERKSTVSQSAETNLSTETATVQRLLDQKGGAIFSIKPEETLKDAVILLGEKRIGALIVTDPHGALVGILSERDIVRKLAKTPGQTLPQRVEEIMTRKVEVCDPTEALVSVLRRMTKGRFRHMPVLKDGNLLGMVTIGDVVHFRLNELEHEAIQLKQMIVG